MDGKAQAAFYAILTADQQAKYDSMLPGASAAQVAGWDPGASTLRRARVPRDSRRRLLVVCGKQINDYPARRGHV
jgi:hypothetical protein